MTFFSFFSHQPFYHFLPFRVYRSWLLFPIVWTLYTPCIHTRLLFFTFLHLALCSRNNKYYIRHLFLLNSSLHKQPFITAHFVHHCTLKQALALASEGLDLRLYTASVGRGRRLVKGLFLNTFKTALTAAI